MPLHAQRWGVLCAAPLALLLFSFWRPAVAETAAAAESGQQGCQSLRDDYLRLMAWALTGSLYDEVGQCGDAACELTKTLPYNHTSRHRGEDWPVVGHTMVGHIRLANVRHALETVVSEGVKGDFAELGVWRGGASMFAKAVLRSLGDVSRKVMLFDAFEAIPQYGDASGYLSVSEAAVRHNFRKYGLLDERVRFIKGMFNESLPLWRAGEASEIAVLRVDSNYYDSYQDAMYRMYDLVPVGGFVIFDDINSHTAVSRFWDDFKREQGLKEELVRLDKHSAYFRKAAPVAVDAKYFRPPQDANL